MSIEEVGLGLEAEEGLASEKVSQHGGTLAHWIEGIEKSNDVSLGVDSVRL